jgi:hypothetical protein
MSAIILVGPLPKITKSTVIGKYGTIHSDHFEQVIGSGELGVGIWKHHVIKRAQREVPTRFIEFHFVTNLRIN